MPASAPPSASPVILTTLPDAAFLSLKAAVPLTLSTSLPILPVSTAPDVSSVVAVKPSYTLLPASKPLSVMVAGVMSPVMPVSGARM